MNELFVYSFRVSTYVDRLDQLKIMLSSEEVARAYRFVREQDAQAYIVSHALLRRILSCELDCRPLDVIFTKNAQGKPFLLNSGIHFNLSHSGDYVLIAVSRESPVGVDIERHQYKRNVLEIADRYFTSEECLYIKKHHDQKMVISFYDVWSAKEAYVKALGGGIAYGFDRFSVINSVGCFASSIEGLLLTRLNIGDTYSAAVVGSIGNISIRGII